MRFLILLYGLLGYVAFFPVALWLVCFLLDAPLAPRGVGAHLGTASPSQIEHTASAILIDVGLILLIGVQHGTMARAWFQRTWTRLLPEATLRPTFIWTANLSFAFLFLQWRPLPDEVWRLEGPFAVGMLHGLAAAGWLLALASTFALGHLRLFGVAQVLRHFEGRRQPSPSLQVGFFYKVVRHPLLLGLLIGCWSTPHMTLGRLVFALTMSSFVALAIPLEERKLSRELGEDYRDYRRQVPMLLPFRLDAGSGPGS